jgi:hypothetical protein
MAPMAGQISKYRYINKRKLVTALYLFSTNVVITRFYRKKFSMKENGMIFLNGSNSSQILGNDLLERNFGPLCTMVPILKLRQNTVHFSEGGKGAKRMDQYYILSVFSFLFMGVSQYEFCHCVCFWFL